MTAESIKHGDIESRTMTSDEKSRGSLYLIGLSVVLITGAIAALGSHLMPSESLLHGLTHDLAPESHPAVRLRILHPLLALAIPVTLLLFAKISVGPRAGTSQALWYRRFTVATGIAVAIGLATLSLLAPVWLKLTHLFMTNILVIVFSLCLFHTLRPVETTPQPNDDL
jgi:hypothetical protein